MKKTLLTTLFFLSTSISYADDSAGNAFEHKAQVAIKAFATELKSALVSSMKSQGPVETISVCKDVAPQIAAQLSEKYGLEIGRTSLKHRNPNNKPDDWERSVLVSFEDRQQAGEEVQSLQFMEQVSTDSGTQWRLMKAIPTGEVCLTCHGQNIPATVLTQLNKLYPEDTATGFKLGQIRGAFTVAEPR